jgi:hypothetical protein
VGVSDYVSDFLAESENRQKVPLPKPFTSKGICVNRARRRLGPLGGNESRLREIATLIHFLACGKVEKWEALRRKTKVEEICSTDGGIWNSASLAIAKAVSKRLDCVKLDPEEHFDLLPNAEAARLGEMPSRYFGSSSNGQKPRRAPQQRRIRFGTW